jgi:hypothetical protein
MNEYAALGGIVLGAFASMTFLTNLADYWIIKRDLAEGNLLTYHLAKREPGNAAERFLFAHGRRRALRDYERQQSTETISP